MLKNDLLCYSPMLLNVAYYATDSYPLFHIILYKISNEIHHTTQNSFFSKFTVLVHRPFSTTLQQNYQGCNTVSTVRESEFPPLWPLVPLLLGKSLISPLVAIFFSAHCLGIKVMFHMTLINNGSINVEEPTTVQCHLDSPW